MSSNHRQISVPLKYGKTLVDEGIAPLVVWMDSFKSVVTLGSCQGNCRETSLVPMIHFQSNMNDLIRMMRFLRIWYYDEQVTVEVGYNPVRPRPPKVKYTLKFNNKASFDRAMKLVGKLWKN
jgi:hypothetical protein